MNAKKTKADAEMLRKFPVSRGAEPYEMCSECGHTYEAHIDTTCPPTPPSKAERPHPSGAPESAAEFINGRGERMVLVDGAYKNMGKPAVKVDEASTSFKAQVEKALGLPEGVAKAAEAEEHFDRRVVSGIEAEIAIKNLRPYGNNPREQLGDVKSLVESIERIGFVGVLLVRQMVFADDVHPDLYEVVSGNRRLEAAKQAGLERVPCHIYELSDVQALEMNLAEQINRRDLTPLEEAEGCRRLIELAHYSHEQVGQKLGQSKSWVLKRLSLCGLAAETKKALAKGALSLTVAQGIANLPTQKLQAEATKTALDWAEGGYGAEETLEKLRAEVVRPLSGVPFKLTDADLVPEAGACSKCPYNSTNAQMPGLFDNAKAGATCAKVVCLDEKLMAAWKRDAAPYVERGAKLLSLSESARIFRGNAETLDSASKYVIRDAAAPQDRTKRTWHELMKKAGAGNGSVTYPQVYVARDGKGHARELLLAEAARKVVAEKLKLKWAMEVEGEEATSAAKADAASEQIERDARESVREQVLGQVVRDIASKGLALADVRASILDDDGEFEDLDFKAFSELLAMDAKAQKAFKASATLPQLVSYFWFRNVSLGVWREMPKSLVRLGEAHGLDVPKMLKAQLDGAKAEALMTKKAG